MKNKGKKRKEIIVYFLFAAQNYKKSSFPSGNERKELKSYMNVKIVFIDLIHLMISMENSQIEIEIQIFTSKHYFFILIQEEL